MRTGLIAAGLLLLGFAGARQSAAQSALDRTPNLSGGWTGAGGSAYFHLVHRFNESGAPEHKVTSAPTFLAAYAPHRRGLVGVNYATNSEVAERFPNEWEVFGRWAAWERSGTRLSLQAGYNLAAESADGAAEASVNAGPARLLGAVRLFSDALHRGTARAALAGGAVVDVGPVSLAADVGRLLGEPAVDVAWGVGLQLALPYTPHTLSLQVTNTSTATLQGSSAGTGRVTYGFEFTIPLTLSRYFGSPPAPVAAATGAPADTVVVPIRDMAFAGGKIEVEAGTRVRWRNEDGVVHTVTSKDGLWDSGLLKQDQSYDRVFLEPGEFRYNCMPHPFMEGVVVVRPRHTAAGGAR